jgi:serine/threonine protein phosphatase PrpC
MSQMFQALRSFFSGTQDEAAENGTVGPAIHAAAQSHAGRVRAENEDSVYLHVETPTAFALVADGMGGSQGGKRASEMAARTIAQMYESGSGSSPATTLRKAFEAASKEIYREAAQDKSLEGMGTTCVALAVRDSRAWAAWVGDSRLYLIRAKRMFQMTEDHSMVRQMVREGLLTSAEASEHGERSVITRALGSKKTVAVSVWDEPYPIRPGDRYLLCSDGLHDVVPEDDILSIATEPGVERSCAALVEAANQRGGPDNVSAILVEIGEG